MKNSHSHIRLITGFVRAHMSTGKIVRRQYSDVRAVFMLTMQMLRMIGIYWNDFLQDLTAPVTDLIWFIVKNVQVLRNGGIDSEYIYLRIMKLLINKINE